MRYQSCVIKRFGSPRLRRLCRPTSCMPQGSLSGRRGPHLLHAVVWWVSGWFLYDKAFSRIARRV